MEKRNNLLKKRGQEPDEMNYSAIKTLLDETVFKLVAFNVEARDELESSLGYGKRSYVFV